MILWRNSTDREAMNLVLDTPYDPKSQYTSHT